MFSRFRSSYFVRVSVLRDITAWHHLVEKDFSDLYGFTVTPLKFFLSRSLFRNSVRVSFSVVYKKSGPELFAETLKIECDPNDKTGKPYRYHFVHDSGAESNIGYSSPRCGRHRVEIALERLRRDRFISVQEAGQHQELSSFRGPVKPERSNLLCYRSRAEVRRRGSKLG